jgi:uncharacterized protein YyaL (SSP411 family)
MAEVAGEHNVGVDELQELLERSRQKLFRVRETRVKPDRDEKILTAWNGLMLVSFAEAAAILDREDYRKIARSNAQFVLQNLRQDGLLLRTYKDGQAKLNAYLEDYAFFSEGLLALYETTGELNWLEEAVTLVDKMIEEFWDDENGGFFYTGKSHEELIVRSKDYFDNATPSGNSVAAGVLLRLAALTDNDHYRKRAVTILRLLVNPLRQYPSAFGRALCALDFYVATPKEIAILADKESPETKSLIEEVWKHYLPNKVVAQGVPDQAEALRLMPVLRDRPLVNDRPTVYVCENHVCREPATDLTHLSRLLTGSARKHGE